MRLANSPAIASVLLMLATTAPSLAWGADGIDVIRAGSEDLRAFDQAISQSRPSQPARPTPVTKAVVGAKVQSAARQVHDQRERDIQDTKSFGQWVKSNNNPSGGKGSAATVSDDGSGTGSGSSSSSARGNSSNFGKGSKSGHGNGH